MFNCVMCKKTIFDESPGMVNGAGSFCVSCKKTVFKRMNDAKKEKRENWDGRCIWCGEFITIETKQLGREDCKICKKCDNGRDWLLKCVRHSDKPYRYILRSEKKEAPEREARIINAEKNPTVISEKTEKNTDTDIRISRLEKLLCKIAEELGVDA